MEKYDKSQRLSDVISHNPQILMVMSRFDIGLGFGHKSIAEICEEQRVDCDTFLSVANFISFGKAETEKVSLESLMSYLSRAHEYFLDFCLPMIRRKLIDAIELGPSNQLALLILKFYDEYVVEVRKHMEYEDREVFEYVKKLVSGVRDGDFGIDDFASHHHGIHAKLEELKDILIRYLPNKDSNMLNVVLFDIVNCEEDLMMHCRVEDRIFVPVVRKAERHADERRQERTGERAEKHEVRGDQISERERDIIRCVAYGLSNKEIAERLCISVNTVTTHRRNTAQKLQIHSPAGLAIYAVINGILKIEELDGEGA